MLARSRQPASRSTANRSYRRLAATSILSGAQKAHRAAGDADEEIGCRQRRDAAQDRGVAAEADVLAQIDNLIAETGK